MLSLRQAIDQLNTKFPRSAIGAFAITDLADLHGVMRAGMDARRPCIVMVSTAALGDMGIHFVREMFQAATMTSPVPLYLMRDRAESVEACAECIDNGFSLVMFDGAALPFDENVRRTREVIRNAHARGVLVEAQVGGDASTDPQEARRFWEETGADLLAISFVSAPGPSGTAPRRDFDVVRETRRLTDAPLVMRGAGLSDEDVRMAIACGVRKVNVEIEGISPTVRALGPARDAVQKVVEGRLDVLCTPRADEMA